ncbi:hypothetical protein [Streptomyces sp. NPDC018833]|uniref:hypothetical protein n=1 Tax=Streptomyces sp. NPDC018833 TaxID=3365053 RepID=UPI0037AC2217
MTQATAVMASCLTERALGRLAADGGVGLLAHAVGTGRILFADRRERPAGGRSGCKVVTSIIADVVQEPLG